MPVANTYKDYPIVSEPYQVYGRTYVNIEIKGKVKQSIIAGRKFEERYIQIKEKKNVDLSAIYLIEPEEIQEESFEKRRLEELEKHPILQHLDRLTN